MSIHWIIKDLTDNTVTMKISIFLVLILTVVNLTAQSSHQLLLEGDNLYTNDMYDKAEEKYRKAAKGDQSGKAEYNLGNALYNQERYEEARNQYQKALQSDNEDVLARAHHNMGNVHFQNQDFKKSIESLFWICKRLEYVNKLMEV